VNKILRLKAAIELSGLGRSTLLVLEAKGEFPKKIKLSERAIGFLESEVEAWILDRAAAREGI